MPIDRDDPDFVASLDRGLAVIRSFGHGSEALGFSDVAQKTGLNRTTARRFLLTLEAIGYLRSDGKLFRLTPKVLDLGYAYLASLPIWEVAQRYMKEIVDQVDESCSLAVLDGTDVVYVARVPPKHFMTLPLHLGTRLPAYVSALGRVLLAHLDEAALNAYFKNAPFRKYTEATVIDPQALRQALSEVRDKDFALLEGELVEERRSIAVPVYARDRRVIAAINLSVHSSRASRERLLNEYLPLLNSAAGDIGKLL